MEAILGRLREGGSVVVLGAFPSEPPPPGLLVIRVRAEARMTSLGPIGEATVQLSRALGPSAARFLARRRTAVSLRRQIMGDLAAEGPEHDLAALAHHVSGATRVRVALVFEGVERADRATLVGLAHMIVRPGFVPLSIALVFATEPQGPAAELRRLAVSAWGDGALFDRSGRTTERTAARGEARHTAIDLDALPKDALAVLRGISVIGVPFDVGTLARLLETTRARVLEGLQHCADAGVPVREHEGGLEVPLALLDTVGASLLPTLRRHYQRRAAALLSRREPGAEAPVVMPRETIGASRAPAARPPVDPEMFYERTTESPRDDRDGPTSNRGAVASAANGLSAETGGARALDAPVVGAAAPAPVSTAAQSYRPPAPSALLAEDDPRDEAQPGAPRDVARAAHHLEEAGDIEDAIGRYVEAAREVAMRGDGPRALLLLERARTLLDARPLAPEGGDALAARVFLETARVAWHGAGREQDFSLDTARNLAREARALAGERPPAGLLADLTVVLAGIEYDLGDVASLDEALGVLSAASRALLDAGEPRRGAELLNDQAAIHLRAGDPVQAVHLLTRSRDLFEALLRTSPEDRAAKTEVAETDHLLARVPLHARLRPGKEADAISLSLDHAIAAERAYRELGRPRDVARVLETMGRLELARGRLDRASEALAASLEISQALGDATQLARTVGATSEVLAVRGRLADAVELLAESIALNLHKGSPIGLGFNRRALDALEARARAGVRAESAEPSANPELGAELAEVRALLERAEKSLAPAPLPALS